VAQVASGSSLIFPILIYASVSLLGTLFSILLPIETRGRPMMVRSENVCEQENFILGNSLLKEKEFN
jgi:hypothetical protein